MPNAQLAPITPSDLFKFKYILSATLSPSGKQIAYVVSHIDAYSDKEFSTIWLMDVESGKARQFTSGTAVDAAPKWSPDGKHIAFMSTRNEKPQLFVMPVDGGEALQLTKLKQGVGSGPSWSPDGEHIAFTAVPIEEARDFSKPYRVDRAVYRFNGMEYLDDVVQSLYIVPTAGGDVRRVTNDRLLSVSPQWSPDGKKLMYLASMFPEKMETFHPVIHLVNLIDNQIQDLTGKWGVVYEATWLPDGNSITFVGQPWGLTIGSKSDLWVVPASGGNPECRTTNLKVGIGGGLEPDMPAFGITDTIPMSADGGTAYVGVQVGGTVQIYSVALSGDESFACVAGGDRTCMLMGANATHLLYIVSTMSNPTDLFVADINGANERQLTHLNEELLSQRLQSRVEHLLFPGSDGVQVEGWLNMPTTGQAPYPAILLIHGGPHGAFGHMYHFDTEMLVGAGYAVLRVNHRASTGYGDEFSTAIKADWGNLDYKDLMAGVDYAISKGWVDANRMGVTGLSGGGNLSCWIVGQTNRFKAALPQNPVTNWVSFYGVSDIGVWFATEQMGGHPWEVPEVYAKCSPITYAHNCKTPTLLMQSEHDWRCPPEQSEQFYTVLKVNGCIVEMVRVPDAAHAAAINGALPARHIHNEVLLDWMNRYVLGKDDKKSA
ncbi:MAG: S9 family peptidase [Anaerolineae bacterium]|nr:S9 family peptidase [Anaerolineae bacterium]